MVDIRTITTMREFQITLNEREMAAVCDMLNWDENHILHHMGFNYSETFGTKEEARDVVHKVGTKFMDAINED